MNKQQLIEAVAQQLGDGASKRQVEEVLNTSLDTVAAALRRGDSVQLTGFGTFEARRRAARKGLNPRTGESVRIRATTVPAFKAGKTLKDVVAKRTAAKKAAAKKAATKKAATKKAAAKKATARKTAAKKTTAKKATAKKTAARKTTPAKATRKQTAKRSAKKTARKG